MKLFLIRHGRSIANEEKLVTGTTLDELSPEGLRQVADLKIWLRSVGVVADRYITSQWRRAQQTADILWPSEEWEINSEIGETDAGDVSEWRLKNFLLKYPEFYQSSDACYPGGESHDQLNARSICWLNNLLKSSKRYEDVVLVAHSGPISCLLQCVVKVSMDRFPAFIPANASMSMIDFPHNSVETALVKGISLGSDEMVASALVSKY